MLTFTHFQSILLFLDPGIFKHSQSVSRSYLAEVTPQTDQSGVLGTFNAASSMGFILGPMVGGRLAETSGGFYKVALVCTVIFVLNAGEFVIEPVHFAIIDCSCFFLHYNPLSKVCSFSLFPVSLKIELFEDSFHIKLIQRSKVKAVMA